MNMGLKIIVSVAVVFILNELAKRVSPLFSGIISGIPLGTGLSVYFIAQQEGIEFVVRGIPWGVMSLCSSLIFCFTYLYLGKRLSN